jgi:hypothetical protein
MAILRKSAVSAGEINPRFDTTLYQLRISQIAVNLTLLILFKLHFVRVVLSFVFATKERTKENARKIE